MRINNNMAALNAWRAMSTNSTNMTKSLEKLSSGYRINKAGDDAAGLAVSEKMRAQIRGMNMAVRNAQDGVSLVQTAEGGASKIEDMLQRMRELTVQAATDGVTADDRALIKKEMDELIGEIDRLAGDSANSKPGIQFNGTTLLDGSFSSKNIQVGANKGEQITLSFADLKTATLGDATTKISAIDVTATGGPDAALTSIDAALKTVNEARAQMGAYQNRLETAISTLQIQVENITSAESRIRDVDMASEMAQFTKHNILTQASQSMLAQANQSQQGILQLLR